MFGKIKKLSRGSKGMEALQAVLLIGAAFVVVWGLMTTWTSVIQPLMQGNVENVLNGLPSAKATSPSGNGSGSNPGAPGAPGSTK